MNQITVQTVTRNSLRFLTLQAFTEATRPPAWRLGFDDGYEACDWCNPFRTQGEFIAYADGYSYGTQARRQREACRGG